MGYGCEGKDVACNTNMYEASRSAILLEGEKLASFRVEQGVAQGCSLSPIFSVWLIKGAYNLLCQRMRGYMLIFRTTVSVIIHLLPFPRISCLHQPVPISSSYERRRFFY